MTDSTLPDDVTPVPDDKNRTDDPDRADARADAPDQPGGERRGGNKPGAPGNDDRLKGMVTDRDIVVKCIAEGGDPNTVTAGSLGEGKPITIGADDDIRDALVVMQEYQVRRLPVIDGHDLVGIISQADIARELSATQTGETVAEISEE